ncbi:MAG: homocysteine S-methyltransferase family protein, partial [Coriobacteriia bacterium]|nr:homocysteine S-methyltransferase family protein [Coriobacteriia bacterium]
MRTFKERLGREMLVLEGAMGTMLQKAGLLGDGAPEMLNLIEPDSISRIHSFYRLAGADCAITNTFGANRVKLAHYNSADLVEEINRKSIALARKGAAPYMLADIGPTGLVNDDFDEIHDVFFQQAKALASGGPDAFLLETFTDIAEIRCAILACRDADADLPIIASVSFGELGRMELSGTDPETAAVILESLGVDAIGLNCGLGPQQMEPLARAMRAATVLPIIVQPNAGMPVLAADGSTLFPGKPEDFSIFS